MKNVCTLFCFCYLSLVSLTFAQAPTHILGQQTIAVVPDHFLRGYDPITVFFPAPPLGTGRQGAEDHPEELAAQGVFQLTPAHPGDYLWVDAQTLQFIPTLPWPALREFLVTVQGQEYPLITFMKAPTDLEPESGSTDLEPISDLTLAFPEPVDPVTLAVMLAFEIQDIPGLDVQKALRLTPADFTIKEIERTALSESVQYVITFHTPIPYGKQLTLHLKLALDESSADTFAEYRFATKPLFRVTGIRSDYHYDTFPIAAGGSVYNQEQPLTRRSNSDALVVDFSNDLGPATVEEIKQFVHFEPAVENFRFEINWGQLYLYFDSVSDTLYKLTLHDTPLRDEAGRVLNMPGATELYFFYAHADPYLRWQISQGIVERFGPQQFPMAGRGNAQADVRVYKLDPFDRNFWPFPDESVEVDEEQRPPSPGEEPAFATNMAQQIQLLGSPLVSQLMPLPMRDRPGELRFGLDLQAAFTRISGAGQPGTYLVGYRTLGQETVRHYARIQVTDICLSTVEEEAGVNFVVTSLQTGQPLAGAAILVEGRGADNHWITVIAGTTDAQGQFHYRHTAWVNAEISRISVTYEHDVLVLNPTVAPPEFANNHWANSRSAWLSWLQESPVNQKHAATRRAHIFTERPVYRPDEPVHLKGYLRYWREGHFTLPSPQERPTLVVEGPGNKRWTYTLQLNEIGSFYHLFDEKDLPSGDYRAYIEARDNADVIKIATFKKENYRIPRFEVNIAGPETAALDQPFKLLMMAEYYAGGKVVGQEVTWEITQFPYDFRPAAYPGFLFSTLNRFSNAAGEPQRGTLRKTENTDKNGSSEILIDPTKDADARAREYYAEVTVTGADEQSVTNIKSVYALPPFVLGLKVERFLKDAHVIQPQFLVLDHNGKPLAGKEFRLRVFQRQWHSYLVESDFSTGAAKYVNDVVDQQLSEQTVTSQAAPFSYDIPVKEAGVYVLEMSAPDKLGRLQTVSADLFVAGNTPIAWEKPKALVFDTVPDKDAYDPGETAQLVLKSPFQQARALIVVEAPDANQYHWLEVQNGQGVFALPLTGAMTPKIPVHILLMRGRVAAPADATAYAELKQDRARPYTMGSTVWLNVRPKSKQLQVKVQHPSTALPGTKIPIKIFLTDPDDQPLNGEVTLWLVDRAVLALGEEQPLDPVPSFIQQHDAYVRLRDMRNAILGELPVEEVPGGDEGKRRRNLFETLTVRKNFKTVPYYNPNIRVVNGIAEVEVELPDNLTDFAVRAVATDGAERFGFTKSMLSVRLPLIVQSALPRFVRPGDRFVAGGIGRVVEGDGGPGIVQIQVEGLRLDDAADSAASTEPVTRSVTWVKDQAEQLYFPLTVTQPAAISGADAQVTIRLAVKRASDGAGDAFELQLPVKRDRQQQQRDLFAQLPAGAPLELLTPTETPRAGSLTQQVLLTYEPALIKMLAGLHYLFAYEHGCTEQRISQLLPELALKEMFRQIGMGDRNDLIAESMAETLRYLERVQQPNGLFSYWPGSRGYVTLTAYVVEFLLAAREADYPFTEALLTKGLKALQEALRSDYANFIDGNSFTERVEALAALAVADQFDEAYAQEYLARATALDLYSEAKMLATYFDVRPADQAAIQRLLQDVWQSVIFKLRDGKEVYEGLQYRDETWGGLLLASEVKTLASITRALHKAEPQNARARVLVNELIARGQGDGWGDTNANAAALLALAQVLDTPKPLADGAMVTLTLSNQPTLLDLRANAVTRFETTTSDAAILQSDALPNAPMPFVWNRLSYLPAGPGDTVVQSSNGFVVERELLLYQNAEQPPLKSLARGGNTLTYQVGDIIEEHIQVVNPEERYFVAVRVPFAAGFDPMNPNLATAPPAARPVGQFTREPDYALYEDDQVTFYYDTLPKGTYDFYFRVKAMFAGSFVHPAANAEMMYKQTIYGHSHGTRIEITPKAQ